MQTPLGSEGFWSLACCPGLVGHAGADKVKRRVSCSQTDSTLFGIFFPLLRKRSPPPLSSVSRLIRRMTELPERYETKKNNKKKVLNLPKTSIPYYLFIYIYLILLFLFAVNSRQLTHVDWAPRRVDVVSGHPPYSGGRQCVEAWRRSVDPIS